MPESPACPQCGDDNPNVLGQLGHITYHRCRSCGWTYGEEA